MRPPGPVSGTMRAVPLLDLLLRVRQEVLQGATGPFSYIGDIHVNDMDCFISGYWQGLDALGVEPGSEALFSEWLISIKRAWPGEGWAAAYLREFGGDQVRALRKYLDFVAEFRSLPPEALAAIPWRADEEHPSRRTASWTPTRVPAPTLDLLLEIRGTGRPGMYIGDVEVKRLAGLLQGYRLCLELAGAGDQEYPLFEQWLHERKDIPLGWGWEQALLKSCDGDQERAVRQFLELAAEFRSAGR